MKLAWLGSITFGLAVALGATAPALGQDKEEIEFSDCPPAVQKTLRAEAKGANIDGVVKETEDGKTTYWTGVEIDGRTYAIGVEQGGMLAEVSLDVGDETIPFADCPDAVQKTLLEESREGKLGVVSKDVKFGGTVYQVSASVGTKTYEIVVAEDGTLVEKTLLVKEEAIALTDCPAAVQKAFKDAARGGEVGEVTRSSGITTPVYEAEAAIGGHRYLLEVAEGGTLITKLRVEDDV